MKFKLIIILSIFNFLVTFSQSEFKILKKAYNKKSGKDLELFFETWEKEINPITDKQFLELNDTVKNAYNIFSAFYKPLQIDSLGGSEWGNDIYKKAKYLVIQDEIKIYFADKVFYTEKEKEKFIINWINNKYVKDDSLRNKLLKRDENGNLAPQILKDLDPNTNTLIKRPKDSLFVTISNFHPIVKQNKKILYLTQKYSEILNDFLKNQHSKLGKNGIMNPAKAEKESKRKKEFLEKYIVIWYGHWGGYWQLHSYPKAYSITFDSEMKYARVDFEMVYEGGEAILMNDNGNWKLISAKRTWIE